MPEPRTLPRAGEPSGPRPLWNWKRRRTPQIIESYGEVAVTAAADDPTVCLVEFSFAVAHGLNQIRLTVHLTV